MQDRSTISFDAEIRFDRLQSVAANEGNSALLAAVTDWAIAALDCDFVSLTSFEAETWAATRISTTHPDEFPTGGRKACNETWWTDWVIRKKKTFVANTAAEIAEVFFDHQVLARLGLNAAVNVPIVFEGAVIGTINAFGPEGHFNDVRLSKIDQLRLAGLVAFLSARCTHELNLGAPNLSDAMVGAGGPAHGQ